MKTLLLSLAAATQWAAWGAPATPAPWSPQPMMTTPYGAMSSPSPFMGMPAGYMPAPAAAPQAPGGASEADPIVVPLSMDVQGQGERTTYYAAYVPSGAATVHILSSDATLGLRAWPAADEARAVSTRARPYAALVLSSAEQPWIIVRVRSSDARNRYLLRIVPSIIGEAPNFAAAAPATPQQQMPAAFWPGAATYGYAPGYAPASAASPFTGGYSPWGAPPSMNVMATGTPPFPWRQTPSAASAAPRRRAESSRRSARPAPETEPEAEQAPQHVLRPEATPEPREAGKPVEDVQHPAESRILAPRSTNRPLTAYPR